jgi:outer membrane protein assembly factor BamB
VPSFKVAWTSPRFDAGPPVVAGSTVITLDLGSGTLYGFSVDSGDQLFKIPVGNVMHFTTPSLSKGRVFVAADRQIVCLGESPRK